MPGKQSGVKTSINPHQGFTDIREALLHGHRDWKMVALRRRIEAARKAQVAVHKAMLQHEQEAEIVDWEAMPSKERERSKREHEERVRKYDEALKQAADTALAITCWPQSSSLRP